jgi:hypothetical protein
MRDVRRVTCSSVLLHLLPPPPPSLTPLTGTLRLNVPWKKLKTERVEIHIDNVIIFLAATSPLSPPPDAITRRSQLRLPPPSPPALATAQRA